MTSSQQPRPQRPSGLHTSPLRAVGVACTWLTILPMPRRVASVEPDRRLGGAVMSAVPVVGVLVGATCAALALALSASDLPPLIVGVLVVAALALMTRGMHLDGLADTTDGLGCYGPPERVTEVMRSGTVGPFGVAALVVVIGIDATAFAALADQSRWYDLAFAITIGRVAAVLGARRGLSPAHRDGFGALVIGTQYRSVALWSIAAIAGAATSGAAASGAFDAPAAVQAAIVVVVVLAGVWAFTRHCARRIGGISGDVLGAVIELGTAATLVGLLL